MTTNRLTVTAPIDSDQFVLEGRRRLFFEAALTSLPISTINILVTGALLVGEVSPDLLIVWTVAAATLTLARYGFARIQLGKKDTIGDVAIRLSILLMGVTGTLWGLCIFMLTPESDRIAHAIIITMIAGTTAGVSVSSATFPAAVIAFNLPCLAITSAYYFSQGTVREITMVALIMLYFFASTKIAGFLDRTIRETLKNEKKIREAYAQIAEQAAELETLATEHESAATKAQAAAVAKSQFLANVSHEIRTPMNGVLGMLTALAKTGLDAQQDEYRRVAQQSAEGLLRLINDILDFSKIESGRVELIDAPFDLRESVRVVEQSLSPGASQKGLGLSVTIDERVPALLAGDETRLRQVLFNLMGNAVNFTERGAVTLRIEHRGVRAGRHQMRVSVIDTGIGIPADKMSYLFERFEQVGAPQVGRKAGTGLGLAISGEIVRLMGSRIDVTSEVGRGSIFAFDIALPSAVPNKKTEGDLPVPEVPPLNLLVAEDNEINQKVMLALLHRDRHRVVLANDGLEAVTKAAEERFDCILLDMRMPRMSGLDAASVIRSGKGPNATTPMIAVTAQGEHETSADMMAAGVQAFVSKPIDLKTLTTALQNAVAK